MARLDPSTFDALVRDHHVVVYRAAWRVLREASAAEDVTQEVFLRLFDGRIRVDGAREPAGVLVWAAVRAALSRRRADAARAAREEHFAMADERRDGRADPRDPSARLTEAEQVEWISSALPALPPDHQEALALRFQEGWTFAAIGRALGISEPSALARVRKGVALLRQRAEAAGLAGLVPLLELEAGAPAEPPIELPVPAAPGPREGLTEALRRLPELHAPLAPTPSGSGAGASSAAVGAGGLSALLLPVLALGAAAVLLALGLARAEPEEGPLGEGALAAGVPGAGSTRAAAASIPGSTQSVPRRRTRRAPLTNETRAAQAATDPAVVDVLVRDADGAPVAGADVRAFVRAPGLKFPSEHVTATSDGRGRARLELPVGTLHERLAGEPWALLVDHEAAPRASQTLQDLEAGATRELVVELAVRTAPVAFELDVLVRDADGPVAGASVQLGHRPVAGDAAVAPPLGPRAEVRLEAGGTLTGPDGRVTLEGRWSGHKLVVVDGRAVGRTLERSELMVDGSGVHALEVTLGSAWELEGRIEALDGSSVAGALLTAYATPDGWREPWFRPWWDPVAAQRVGPDGRFRILANPPTSGAGALWLALPKDAAEPWSPFAREVRAGEGELLLHLKRASDPVVRGLHLAELHGRLDLPPGVEVYGRPGNAVRALLVPDEDAHGAAWEDFLAAALLGDVQVPGPRQQQGLQGGAGRRQVDLEPQVVAQTVAIARTSEDPLRFQRVGLPAGRVLLVTRVYGTAPASSGPWSLEPETVLADLELAPGPGRTVEGVVLGASGVPLAGALVTLAGPGPRGAARLQRLDAWIVEHPRAADWGRDSDRTDRFGRFRLEHVPAGPLQLAAAHPLHAPTAEPLPAPGEPARFVLARRDP